MERQGKLKDKLFSLFRSKVSRLIHMASTSSDGVSIDYSNKTTSHGLHASCSEGDETETLSEAATAESEIAHVQKDESKSTPQCSFFHIYGSVYLP